MIQFDDLVLVQLNLVVLFVFVIAYFSALQVIVTQAQAGYLPACLPAGERYCVIMLITGYAHSARVGVSGEGLSVLDLKMLFRSLILPPSCPPGYSLGFLCKRPFLYRIVEFFVALRCVFLAKQFRPFSRSTSPSQ
jgi:hypothetical protein